jgi:hypothetical protein
MNLLDPMHLLGLEVGAAFKKKTLAIDVQWLGS